MEIEEDISKAIMDEYYIAERKFAKFNSAHEGFAILKEEVDELWDNVKLNQKNPLRDEKMLKEAIQIGAMALRFIKDVIPKEIFYKFS